MVSVRSINANWRQKAAGRERVCWLLDEKYTAAAGHSSGTEGEIRIPEVATPCQIFASSKEPDERVSRLFLLNIYHTELQIQMPQKCRYEGMILLEAIGGAPPYIWAADGLPLGMCLDGNRLCGEVHVRGGTAPVTLTVTDRDGERRKTIFIEIP